MLGGNSPSLEGAAVLGGIEGVKLRLQNPDSKVRIAALQQALNYGEQGLDLVIAGLNDQSWDIQNAAYLILYSSIEPIIKQILQKLNQQGFKLEQIEVVTVNKFGKIIQRQPHINRYFVEDLGNGVTLEMAVIPGGTFMMGSPENEEGRWTNESPQHQVTVSSFFMGKYPVTEAQYQAIMGTNPYGFKGSNRPIESISWNDAVAFCQELSQRAGRNYRLPSEAEWEYACRAGTTTPFHFGETITTDLANYDGKYTYGYGIEGINREETTVISNFRIANNFGLYDMHGNIWEWCLDDWVDSYNNALTNGNAMTNSSLFKVLRGGSWFNNPADCRSARRFFYVANCAYSVSGFRVVCGAA
ncbi:formylglycine-generating enzyme family protein [Cuspidothrix issatschenkoi]|uniref:formylglycine-generating enzyme family protein n=1 Tax=Cuspidothrix issatschenkoi TaxID=230752 RepID=UPI002AD280C1|nr:formylglycine-generating enzyme family protein [Cuspidothrix issatschenkoi]